MSSIKVEISDTEARRLKDEWEQRAFYYENEAANLRSAIAAIDAQLNGQIPGVTISGLGAKDLFEAGQGERSKKKRKGENLRTITSYMKTIGGRGISIAEISKTTGIGISSCSAVFNRHEGQVFTKGQDGLWHLKQQ